jgi:hypothetical protein
MKTHTFFLALASTLVLSACGGGGGGTGASTGPTPVQTSTLTPITAGNAGKAAANGYAANTLIGDSSSSVTGVLTGVSIDGTGISAAAPVLKLVKRAFGPGAPLLTGVTVSQACSGGGSVTIDANLRNTQTISNGDTMTVKVLNCVEDGNKLNGSLSIAFSDVSGDPINTSSGAATMDTRFTGFSIVNGSETATVNGDMKIAFSLAGTASTSVTISGKSLQTTAQTAGGAAANLTLGDYTLTGSTKGTTITVAANFTLSGNASGLGQFAYTVKSLQPFVSVGTAMPGSGSLIVNGAASSVTVTAVNASSVRLDYSAKGDGVITQTTTLSWADFIASI